MSPTYERSARFVRDMRKLGSEQRHAFLGARDELVAGLRTQPPRFAPRLRIKQVQGSEDRFARTYSSRYSRRLENHLSSAFGKPGARAGDGHPGRGADGANARFGSMRCGRPGPAGSGEMKPLQEPPRQDRQPLGHDRLLVEVQVRSHVSLAFGKLGLRRSTRGGPQASPSRHPRQAQAQLPDARKNPNARRLGHALLQLPQCRLDVRGEQVEVEVVWLVGIERAEAEPLPPCPGAGVQCGDDDRAACCLLVQLDGGREDMRCEGTPNPESGIAAVHRQPAEQLRWITGFSSDSITRSPHVG